MQKITNSGSKIFRFFAKNSHFQVSFETLKYDQNFRLTGIGIALKWSFSNFISLFMNLFSISDRSLVFYLMRYEYFCMVFSSDRFFIQLIWLYSDTRLFLIFVLFIADFLLGNSIFREKYHFPGILLDVEALFYKSSTLLLKLYSKVSGAKYFPESFYLSTTIPHLFE